jgi:PTS system nitrogen regulatory IIA component
VSAIDLTPREAARLLGISEGTLQKWTEQGRIPARQVDGELRFARNELQAWANRHRHTLSAELFASSNTSDMLSMHAAIVRGGVHHDLPGRTRQEVLGAAAQLREIPDGMEPGRLRDLLIAREELASTGIGHGVAVPHTRDPMVAQVDKPVVLLCFLQNPVDFKAIDGQPVTVLFVLLSPGVRLHLRLLARLAWLLHDEQLSQLLTARAPANDILERVRLLERQIAPGAAAGAP